MKPLFPTLPQPAVLPPAALPAFPGSCLFLSGQMQFSLPMSWCYPPFFGASIAQLYYYFQATLYHFSATFLPLFRNKQFHSPQSSIKNPPQYPFRSQLPVRRMLWGMLCFIVRLSLSDKNSLTFRRGRKRCLRHRGFPRREPALLQPPANRFRRGSAYR